MIPMVQPQGAHLRPPNTGISQRVQPPAHTGPIPGPMKPKTLVCVTGCSQQGATPAEWQPKSPTEQPQTPHPKNPGT